MAEHLRIALVSPIAGPTGPGCGSSIEQLVFLMAEELKRRGHAVTLCATGDSQTSAALHTVYRRGYKDDHLLWNNYEFHEIMHAASVFEHAQSFDIIHSHAYHYALPFVRLVDTPVIHTYHINPNPDVVQCYGRYPETKVVAVSCYHRSKFRALAEVPVVYNGIDTAAFSFRATPGDYLVFLGHLIEKKGPLEAIGIAKQAGMRLVMAGQGGDYFEEKVAPLVDGRQIEYIGPVGPQQRNELLSGAGALIFPINYSEPFGLVMLEAMACGTPVVASARCAVPEIVQPEVNGFYAKDIDALAALVPHALPWIVPGCDRQWWSVSITGVWSTSTRGCTGRW